MNSRLCLVGVGVAILATASGLRADPTIDYVLVQKTHGFFQTGDSSVIPASGPVDPAEFSVSLEGTGLSSYGGTLTFTSPGGSGVSGGTGSYDGASDRYAYSQTFTGGSAYADLNSAFGDGSYDVSVSGTHVALNLSGDLFPAAPIATITGATGVWDTSEYIVQPGHDLAISALFSDAATYGPGNAHVSIEINGNGLNQTFDQFATSGSLDVLASSLVSGQSYDVRVSFAGVVDADASALSPTLAAALYTSETTFLLTIADPTAVPEPATYALWLAAAGLAAGLIRRRRAVA